MPVNPPSASVALAAESLFRPKLRFQSSHFYAAESSNDAYKFTCYDMVIPDM